MANNGNTRSESSAGDPRLEKLSDQLRNVPPGTPALEPAKQPHPRTFDNLMSRTDLTAEACDELARYFTSLAEHFRKTGREVRHNVLQMLGDIGTPDRGRGQA